MKPGHVQTLRCRECKERNLPLERFKRSGKIKPGSRVRTCDNCIAKKTRETKAKNKRVGRSTSQVEANDWRLYSLLRRQEDAAARGENGIVQCCTCPRRLHWTELQAGHYADRNRRATKYMDITVHCQCENCNGFPASSGVPDTKGRPRAYRQFLDSYYGPGTADRIDLMARVDVKRRKKELEGMEIGFLARLKAQGFAIEIKKGELIYE